MSALIAVVHLLDNNGMPADDSLNTFVFESSGSAVTLNELKDEAMAQLQDFYCTAAGGSDHSVGEYLSASIQRGGSTNHHVMFYRLADMGSTTPVTPLGGPIDDIRFTVAIPPVLSTTELPRECAAVLSYTDGATAITEDVPGGEPGPKGDTHPAARHRGRIYLGPLNSAGLGAGANGPGVHGGFRLAATKAALHLKDSMTSAGITHSSADGTLLASWCIWSRKDHVLRSITDGWMDDGFDTQRRRGIKATNRTVF